VKQKVQRMRVSENESDEDKKRNEKKKRDDKFVQDISVFVGVKIGVEIYNINDGMVIHLLFGHFVAFIFDFWSEMQSVTASMYMISSIHFFVCCYYLLIVVEFVSKRLSSVHSRPCIICLCPVCCVLCDPQPKAASAYSVCWQFFGRKSFSFSF